MTRRTFVVAALGFVAGCSQTTGHPAPSAPQPTSSTSTRSYPPASDTPTSTARASIKSLGMIGDSITVRSKPALATVLTAKGIADVTVDAQVNRRIHVGNGKSEPLNGQQALTNLLKIGLKPDVWVFALGTNDVNNVAANAYAALIESMLAMPPANTPVVWVDVYRPSALEQTKVFNAALRATAAKRPRTTVASWFDLASDKKRKLLSSDNLHPNEAGEAAFAALVGDAVAQLR